MRRARKIFVFAVCCIAGWWLLQKFDFLPSFSDMFVAKKVEIDETGILIKEIKSIGQLVTYSALDELVVDSTIITRGSAFVNSFNRLVPVPLLPSADKHLVLIGKGKVLAGTNLALLNDSSVVVNNDTVTIVLPKPVILDAILNPGDFETFMERGEWTSEEVTLVKIKARRKMIERALQRNILEKAGDKSKAILQDFLGNMGYKYVQIL